MTGEARDRELELLRRRAERAEAELREFAYVLSHDLRTPLAAVTGYLELLAARHGAALGDEARDFLHRSSGAAGRLSDMLDGLSRLARLPVAVEFRRVAWGAVVAAAIAELPDDIASYADRVTVSEDLPDVDGDAEQLRVLIGELLDNALRHHDVPERARVVVRPSEYGSLVVEDDGPGVPDRLLDRILDPFKTSGTPGPHGGVGLAIARHVAEVHGGEIALHHSSSGGLRVSVRLARDRQA